MRRKDNVPAGTAGEHFRQHLLVALVRGVPDAHPVLGFESRDRLRRHIGRPVVDVEPRPPVPGAPGEARDSEEEGTPPHASRTRSEIRMMMPKSTVISDEIALMTG